MEDNYESPIHISDNELDSPQSYEDEDLTVDYDSQEIWLSLSPIGFSCFEISNHGRVRNSYTQMIVLVNNSKEKTPKKLRDRSRVILIDDDHHKRNLEVSRLVVIAFNSSLPEYFIVKHKDGNNLNNRLENLLIKSIKRI